MSAPWKVSYLFAALLLLGACVRAGTPRASTSPDRKQPKQQELDRRLVLEVHGTIEHRLDSTHKMQFYSRHTQEPTLRAANVATISTRFPTEFTPGRGIIVGISVVGPIYEGDGSYTIEKRHEFTSPSPGQQVDLSIVRVEIYDMTAQPIPTLAERIDTLARPCKVELEDEAVVGSLSCPEIANAEGQKISVEMAWRSA